jgi:hypothetical protein
MWILENAGQGWVQPGEFGLAFVLSALIGVERNAGDVNVVTD